MELFKWTDEYSVNSEVLDNQHKKLFEITNLLFTAFSNNVHRVKMQEILSELQQYTKYHFTEEENLLQQKGLPLPDWHRQTHKDFIGKIDDFAAKFKAGKLGVTYEMMGFLRKWLTEHILGADKQYASAFAFTWPSHK